MDEEDALRFDDVVLHLADDTLLRGLADLRWRLDDLLAGHPPQLVIDISALTRLSSATLAALLWAQRTCRSRGGRVVLRGPNKRCLTVLARTGLADLFAVAEGHAVPARAGGTLGTPTP